MDSQWMIDQLKYLWKILKTPIVEFSNTKLSLSSLLFAILIVIFFWRIAIFVGRFLNGVLTKRQVDSGVRDSLEKFARYLTVTIGIFIACEVLGFSLNSLAAVGAVLMVGIGFGLQNITQNFISGIIILIERPVKVGDIIRVGDTSGKIVDIRVRSTVILTRDEVSIIVPNSQIVTEEVVNESFSNQRIRQHVKVGVAYGSDTEAVRKVLLSVAENHAEILKSPEAAVIFDDFGDSSLNFDLRFWTSQLWEIDRVCSEVRYQIDSEFRKHKIQIPFPQRDVHFKGGNYPSMPN